MCKKLCKWWKNLRKWQRLQVVAFLITVFIALFITNQIVQPLFKPRLAEMDITPLYIQSLDEDYFIVAMVSYKIEVPLCPICIKKLNLFVPNKHDTVELNTQFKEENPYITVSIFDKEEDFTNFVKIKEIPIIVNTNGFKNKILTSNFYIRERLDKDRFINRASTGYSVNYWWTPLSVLPIKDCMVAISGKKDIGYGLNSNSNYTFSIIFIRNNCDLEVKGYKINLEERGIVCDKDIRLQEVDRKVSLDLNPKETRKLLIVKENKNTKIYTHDFTFPFEYRHNAECIFIWKKFKETFYED